MDQGFMVRLIVTMCVRMLLVMFMLMMMFMLVWVLVWVAPFVCVAMSTVIAMNMRFLIFVNIRPDRQRDTGADRGDAILVHVADGKVEAHIETFQFSNEGLLVDAKVE